MERQFDVRVERADQVIKVTVLEPEDAELLQAPPFSPAFFITRAGFDARGRVIEYAESLDVPFVFASNGDAFLFHDRTGQSDPVEVELACRCDAAARERVHDHGD